MRHEYQYSSPMEFEPALRALLALVITERDERRPATAPRSETILARAGLTDAEIAAILGQDPIDVRANLDRDRPVSVIDRARAHMTRATT
jgi:hypothetical protein